MNIIINGSFADSENVLGYSRSYPRRFPQDQCSRHFPKQADRLPSYFAYCSQHRSKRTIYAPSTWRHGWLRQVQLSEAVFRIALRSPLTAKLPVLFHDRADRKSAVAEPIVADPDEGWNKEEANRAVFKGPIAGCRPVIAGRFRTFYRTAAEIPCRREENAFVRKTRLFAGLVICSLYERQ